MDFSEVLNRLISFTIIDIFDFLEEAMGFVCVIMMMVCFFGREGKITFRTLRPLIIYSLVGIILFSIFIVRDYIVLYNTEKGAINDQYYYTENINFISIIYRVTFYIFVFMTSRNVFVKNKILNGIASIVLTYVFLEYFMSIITYAAAYYCDDSRKTLSQLKDFQSVIGKPISFVCVFALFFILLFIMLALYFGMIIKQRYMYIGWKYRIMFIVWMFIMVFVHMIPFNESLSELEHERYVGIEMGINNPILGLVIPFIVVTLISRRYAIEKALIQENYISAELDYIIQYKKDQDETRAFRHDIINNLSMLSMMYDEDNYDDVTDHLHTLLGNVKAMSPKYVTGDEVIDCIVGMKASQMEEDHIDFSIEGLIEEGLAMKPMDVCSIFANALDNAIEACQKINDENGRWIKLSLDKTDESYSFILSNSMKEDGSNLNIAKYFTENKRITTKKNRDIHGYGIQSMKAAIRKYNGSETVEVRDGVFILSIVIPRTD